MNKQNFENKEKRFPLSTQSLSFMQDMILASAQLALIGGDNYILSGCTTTGKTVSDGIIVINGEVMPFVGGAISDSDTVTIVEEKTAISANALTFENARVKRYAKFASGTGLNYYPWANFKPLHTNKQLEEVKATVQYVDEKIADIQAGSIPAGVIVMWGGREGDIPQGWTLCDGKELADGKRVPDLRGRFIVGYNSSVGSGYTTVNAGTKNADQYMVTLTTNEMPAHDHGMAESKPVAAGEWGIIRRSMEGEKYTPGSVDKVGAGSEPDVSSSPRSVVIKKQGDGKPFDIRPPYYVLAFIIKINTEN